MRDIDTPQKLVFGVYDRDGNLLWIINRITCTLRQAAVLVAILDMGKCALAPGDYFACDFDKTADSRL